MNIMNKLKKNIHEHSSIKYMWHGVPFVIKWIDQRHNFSIHKYLKFIERIVLFVVFKESLRVYT